MNIFVTNTCPVKSAIALDDRRLNKMITESLQMLASALILSGAQPGDLPVSKLSGKPYRLSHAKHPCTVWAATSRHNYLWLVRHLDAMCQEYEDRNGKSQFGESNVHIVLAGYSLVQDAPFTPWPNCTTHHKHVEDIIDAYRQEMQHKWTHHKPGYTPTWRGISSFPGWPT